MAEMRQALKPPKFVPPIPDWQLLEWEKELLGTYLSKHPLLDQERELMDRQLITTTIGNHTTEMPGQVLTLVGMVQRVRRITTKKGDMMAFVTLEGSGGSLDVVVFPRVFERFRELLTPNRVLVVSGKLDARPDRDEHPLLAEWFKDPRDFPSPEPPAPPVTVYITLKRSGDNSTDFEKLANLHRVLLSESGSDQFVVVLEGMRKVALSFPNESTHLSPDVREQIVSIVGPENLRVVHHQKSW
jgi:DNA polymerase-3 subunit alpha